MAVVLELPVQDKTKFQLLKLYHLCFLSSAIFEFSKTSGTNKTTTNI